MSDLYDDLSDIYDPGVPPTPPPPPSSPPSAEAIREAEVSRILSSLNPAQKDAVTTTAKVVQILAPPGSGKTKTLTSRVAYMLAHGVEASNIIVATFTVKASKEMKERIGAMIEGDKEKQLVLGTFHSIARRYLVKYGQLAGIPKGFGIADTNDTNAIIKRLLERRGFEQLEPKTVRDQISNMKARMVTPIDFREQAPKEGAGFELSVIYSDYEGELKTSNLLDYDDLLLRCVDLLRQHPRVVSNVEAVLIDEFQDSNLVQYDLMCLLAQHCGNITIVGDPDQSIYGFRAAEIGNLKKMQEKYKDTIQIFLEENYRSSACILHAAIEVIEQDIARPKKPLLPTKGVGCQPVLKKLPTPYAEAFWMAKEILRICAMSGRLISLNDIAILVRTSALTRIIESVLVEQRISYRMVAGTKFFDRLEVRNVLDYLRVLYSPTNNDALARIINVPPRRIGEVTIKGLMEEAAERKKSLWELIVGKCQGKLSVKTKLNKPAEEGLSKLVNVVLSSKWVLDRDAKSAERALFEPESDEAKGRTTFISLVNKILGKLGYEEYLKRMHAKDFDARWANVQELLVQADEFSEAWLNGISASQENELPTIHGIGEEESDDLRTALGRFLANVALSSSVDTPEDGEAPAEQVTISTIHNAKGLEWPVVFVPGCFEGSIPHSRAEDQDEERRLLYVAMTRAKGLLYMSYPLKNSRSEKISISNFLSAPKINRVVTKAGPPIPPSTVQSLSQILHRDCPTLEQIRSVVASANLESEEDELWLKDDFKLTQADSQELDEEEDTQWSKRQRTNTMGGFRMAAFRPPVMPPPPPPGANAGFVSAGVRMRELTEEEKNRPRDKQRTAPFDAPVTQDTENKTRGRKKKDTGCHDIQKFFASKTPAEKTSTTTGTKKSKASSTATTKSASGIAVTGKRPMNSVTSVSNDKTNPEFILLSSPDPPRTKSYSTTSSSSPSFTAGSSISTHMTTMSTMQGIKKPTVARNKPTSQFMAPTSMMSVNNTTMSSVGVKNTTMGQLDTAAQVGPATTMSTVPRKRTLGIRRQMDGWNNRAHK